jgi:phage antirepressor YoqD-like protein
MVVQRIHYRGGSMYTKTESMNENSNYTTYTIWTRPGFQWAHYRVVEPFSTAVYLVIEPATSACQGDKNRCQLSSVYVKIGQQLRQWLYSKEIHYKRTGYHN